MKKDYYCGLGLIRVGVDNIKLTKLKNEGDLSAENRPYIDNIVSDNEFALFLSIAKAYNQKLYLGINTKLLGKFVEIESAYGIGFDIAALYNYNSNWKFAAKIQDLTTSFLAWSSGQNEFIKPSILTSVEYSAYVDYLKSQINIYLGSNIRTEGYDTHSFANLGGIFDFSLHSGVEFLIQKLVFIRGGLKNFDDWSLGGGVTFYNFKVDYGFRPDYEDLGNSHKISLNYNWK